MISGFRLVPLACSSFNYSFFFFLVIVISTHLGGHDNTTIRIVGATRMLLISFPLSLLCLCLSRGPVTGIPRMCISMWSQCTFKPIAYRSRLVSMRTASAVTLSFVSSAPTRRCHNAIILIGFSQRSICAFSSGHVPPIATMSASISSQTVASLETLQC